MDTPLFLSFLIVLLYHLRKQIQNTLEQSIFTPEALAANPFGADMIAAQKEQQARETEVRHLIELPLPVLEACLKRFTVEEEADVNRLKREYVQK